MSTAARRQHLLGLVQADIDALPDLPALDPESTSDTDSNVGGVSLEPSQPAPTSTNSPPKEASPGNDDNSERRFVWVRDADSSYNPGRRSLQMPSGPPKAATKLPFTDLQRGDLVSARYHFVPIQALSKYPYKFCDKSHMQPIASAFFDQGKFWKREWDLHYVWDIAPTKPLILVRESQFQTLLDEINSHLKLGLKITDQQRLDNLVVCFPEHPRYRPRYLGRSHSRQEYDSMVENTPYDAFRAAGEPAHPPPDGRSLEDFKQMMEELWDVQKAKTKATKARKHEERTTKQKSIQDQFKRAQRYLGLRTSSPKPAAVDPLLPVPFAFEHSVVFVCVDVESWERDHTKITEVGVATLDTRDLIGISPGPDGAGWWNKIRARHFRINENKARVNTDFVTGCPDRFDFGESTEVSIRDAALMVSTCFKPPFGAHHTNGAGNILDLMKNVDPNEQRTVILLGHDTLGDVRYLQQLGYDPTHANNILEALDTSILYRAWRREHQATNLGKILWSFDIAGWNLHNAGNDAVFTVQAMLAMCVREATIRGSSKLETLRSEARAARLGSLQEEYDQRAKDDTEGWSENEADGDGGAPVPLANAAPQTNSNTFPQRDGSSDRRGRGNGRGRGRGGTPHNGSSYQAPGSGRGRGRGSSGSTRGGHHSEPQVRLYW